MKFTWSVFKTVPQPSRTVGTLVDVDLPQFGMEKISAKVDTGAFSGALHATNIRELKLKTGKKVLRFSPMGDDSHTLEVSKYDRRRVKSSNGDVDRRYVIDTEVTVMGETFPITITLSDRSTMKYQMLIGRNFLRIHGFLVDATQFNQ